MNIICSAGKGEMTTEDCLSCSLEMGSPPCGFDYALLRALFNGKAREGIHVSDLLGCLKKSYLDKVEPQAEYVHEKLTRSLGTAVHAHFEGSDEAMDSELALAYDGLVGTADIVYKNGRVVDYKTTRWIYPDKLPYSSHALQVNLYAYLLKKQGREINSLAIQYIDMSGPTKCRKCKVPYRMNGNGLSCPKCGGTSNNAHLGALLVEVPILPEEDMEILIRDKKTRLMKALDQKMAPEAEPGFLCAYCSHREVCPEGGSNE